MGKNTAFIFRNVQQSLTVKKKKWFLNLCTVILSSNKLADFTTVLQEK